MPTDTVPARLWQTPTSAVEPPVQTRAQDLPVEKLDWPDFERLCCRLAGEEENVAHAQQYGRPGQQQAGIDIFARKFGSERYTTWQCKRYQSVTAKVISKAADEFLSSAWADKTDVFYFCVTDYIEDRTLADTIEAVERRFLERSIRFVPLGKTQLSARLKERPLIVDDFFGRGWVTAFCGSEAEARLSGRKLSRERVAAARKLLRDLYAAHFAAVDPGLPSVANQAMPAVPLLDRFVMPDVLERRMVTSVTDANESRREPGSDERRNPQAGWRVETRQVRSSLARWFEQNRLSVILADAGLGKTTLLRAIALDLLADEPRHEGWTRKWGDRIPVLIPFGTWVGGVTQGPKFGLPDIISNWLDNVGARPELHALLSDALNDDRLLLLVDGIDEWTDEEAAGTALTLLQTFVGSRQVAAVATSRPLGYRRLGGLRSDWSAGDLAPLSVSQQKQLAFRWLVQRVQSFDEQHAWSRATSFIAELGKDAALSQLAATPLLLNGLIALHLAGERLPRNRFLAYQRLTSLLTHEHADRRTRSTLARGGNRWSDETRDRFLDALAYEISTSSSPIAIEYDAARSAAADYLKSALSRTEGEAFEQARFLIEHLRDTRGVLVERSPIELGFIHKSFQDFHAARFLSRRTLDEQQAFIRKWATVPHVADVVLSLCFLINRTADVDTLLDTLELERGEIAPPATDALIAQVAFSGLNCSPERAKNIATASIAAVDADEWKPLRVRLLHSIIDGLDSDLLRPQVIEALSRWFPARTWRMPNVYAATGGWETTPELTRALVLGIRRDEIAARHAAARALAKTVARDAAVEQQLHEEIRTGSGGTVAAALNALGLGWIDSPATLQLLEAARWCRDDEVSLVSALRRVTCGKQNEEDLEILLQFAGERHMFQPKYEFSREIAEAIMSGWPGNDLVRKVSLQSIGARWDQDRAIDVEIAARVLIDGYPITDEIAEAVANVFQTSEFIGNHLGDDWPALLVRYRAHEKLSPAVDFWLKTWKHDAHLWRAFDGALISGSPIAKQYVLDHRDHQWGYAFTTANTLLRGWARDAETDAVLMEMVGTVERAQHVASLIPEILNDGERSEALLFEILEQEHPYRIDGAVEALHERGYDERSIRFADAVFRHELDHDTLGYGNTFSDILKALSRDPRARELARRELSSRDPHADVIAAHFGDDAELRQALLRLTSSAPNELREVVAERLSAIAADDRDAEALLAHYDNDVNARVKTTAAIGYWTARRHHGGIDEVALARLNADLRATGFDTDERGNAALAALIAIDRADIPAAATWEIGGRTSLVGRMRMRRAPLPLLRLMQSRWSGISATFGESLWSDLTGDHAAAIEALAPFADENDELREELVMRIETATSDQLGPLSIALLAREHRGSESLLHFLFRELKSAEVQWNSIENGLAIVDIFGRDFHNDEIAGQLALLAEKGHAQALIGLCDWWPDHSFVRGLHSASIRMDHRLRHRIKVSIDIATLESPELLVALAHDFQRMRGDRWEFHPQATESLLRRLVRDEPLRLAAAKRLISGQRTDDELASWPGLLRRAGVLSPEIARWCTAEVERQRRLKLPDFGMDVNAGRIRAVRRALLDVIAPLS